MLVALLLLTIVGLVIGFTQQIQKLKSAAKLDQDKLREFSSKYDGIISKEQYEKRLDENIALKESELRKLQAEQDSIFVQIRAIQQKLTEVQEEEYIQSFGFYTSKYNFGSSEEYKFKLDETRNKQKNLLKSNSAATCYIEWEVEGSKKKGKKMINDFLTLVLRAFNGECDAAILQVKYNNVTKLETRINKAFETLNKLADTNRCAITRSYLNLKLEELYLTHEFQEKKQEELEEQRRIKEQIRDEERALREIEKAKLDAEKEEKRYRLALEKARQEIELATGTQREVLESKVEQLNQQLREALVNKERAISRAQMTKSGYVYVISNIGSFGENVYKIGMTRRLEPEERIKELSGASVPFKFDIHAMIFSENAPEMENLLHNYFRSKSFNKVNERKEFFRITLNEVADAVEKIAEETKSVSKPQIKFTKVAEAEEFYKTQSIERGETQAPQSTYTPSWDDEEYPEN